LLTNFSSAFLSIGPALVTAGILLCVISDASHREQRLTHGGNS
jgi:hypothetical protein